MASIPADGFSNCVGLLWGELGVFMTMKSTVSVPGGSVILIVVSVLKVFVSPTC